MPAGPSDGHGAKLADSPTDAVAASPLVVICVNDHDAVHKTLDPLSKVLNGRVLVNLTSSAAMIEQFSKTSGGRP